VAIPYNSNYHETMPFSDTCYQLALAANNEQAITVPGTPNMQYQAYFSYTSTSNVFVRTNAIPTVPSAGTFDNEQYNEFRPKKRYVRGGDVIHAITPDTSAYVGISLRQIQGS